MKQLIRFFLIAVLISSVALAAKGQGVYSISPQPVCWSYNGTDSSLLSLVVFDIRDTIGLFQGYVNAINGSYVNTSAGGTISAGYCCCGNNGTSQTVSITDNDDGTYTAIVGTDTTIIYTKADSLYTTQTIQIADTSYLANSVVQDILIAISNEVNNLRNETGCDLTITQASHGFSVGDLLTQDPNTGAYSAAAADTSINFPVAYVCTVIDANNFKVDTEGWVSGAHGETDYRDYFLQDVAGSVDTTSGSFPIFAFRTFTSTLRYYDIPEYVSAGTSGGGSSLSVIASNGLNDADAGTDVDVELGGTIGKNTTVSVPTNYLSLAGNNNLFRVYPDRIRVVPNTANESTRPLGAALRKNLAAGSDANITYTEYGIPYFAPLTFTSHYSVYYESDKTMKWVYWPANGNGAFMNSVLNTSGGSIERTATYGLGGTLNQNTNIYFDSTLYLNFAKDPTVLDTTYEFSLKLDPDTTNNGPIVTFISNVYDAGNSQWNDSEYFFSPDSLSFSLSNSVGAVSSNLSRLNFSRENGLQVYFKNNLTQYIHLNDTDGIKAEYGGTSFQINTSGNLVLSGVPNYASNAAADSDGTLPSGGVYTVTAEDRTLRIKP